ncbi:MAG TPA: SIMPL domain-containing protein [Candidatus Paceibacterota bacterium]|nr:SIMPL domain-containing protein [Candidatus Paceibacterota bacterium]
MNTFFARFKENQFVPLGLILGVAFLVVGIIAAWTAVSIKNASDTLTVTGSATTNVSADTAKWTVTANRTAYEAGIPVATEQVLADTKKIVAFFKSAGIPADSVVVGAVHTDQDYSYSSDSSAPKRYVVRQDVTVSSNDPALIQKLSQDTSPLTGQGIVLTVLDPQYLLSDLPKYRVSLAGDAMKDAKARAEQLVKDAGQSVGRLKSASTAAVQVMAANSLDVSDYGTYDTSTIDKTVMVSVRATFSVN